MYASDATAGAMFHPPKPSSQSKFASFPGDFSRWNYHAYDDSMTQLDEYYYGLGDALRDIGASTDKVDWKFWKITHGDWRAGVDVKLDNQTYVVEGETYRATGALYVMPIEPKAGVLVIAKQYSPSYEATKRRPPISHKLLPDLRFTSDIAYGAWSLTQSLHTPPFSTPDPSLPSNPTSASTPISTTATPTSHSGSTIHHIFSWAIRNPCTTRAITRALASLGKADKDMEFWPGICIPIDSDAGRALLGSPCGTSVGFLLATHKFPLGALVVTSVRVFVQESLAFMETVPVSLYWEVGPARREVKEGGREGV